jgi:hypothetical protein
MSMTAIHAVGFGPCVLFTLRVLAHFRFPALYRGDHRIPIGVKSDTLTAAYVRG